MFPRPPSTCYRLPSFRCTGKQGRPTASPAGGGEDEGRGLWIQPPTSGKLTHLKPTGITDVPPGRPLAIPKEGARLVDKRRRCSLGPHVKVFPGRVCSHANASARTSHPPPPTADTAASTPAGSRQPPAGRALHASIRTRLPPCSPPASWLRSGLPFSDLLLLRPPTCGERNSE